MATVIDALVVTLGLDPTQFKKGSADARTALTDTRKTGDDMAKGLQDAGKKGSEGLANIRKEALALLSVFTAGLGIVSFVKNVIGETAQLGRSASDLNISTVALSEWQLAAKRAGSTAEGITAALTAAQQSVGGAKLGQIDGGGEAFLRFGGDPNKLRSDAQTYLKAQADVIARVRREQGEDVARNVAGQMGVGGSYNFLKQGSGAIDEQMRAQSRLAEAQAKQVAASQELERKWNDFQNALRETSITILTDLSPQLDKLLKWAGDMARWVADHKDDITAWINSAVSAIDAFVVRADKMADSLGGWKVILAAIVGFEILKQVSPILQLATAFGTLATSLGAIGSLGAVALPVIAAALAAWTVFHSESLNSGESDHRITQPGDTWKGDAIGAQRHSSGGDGADRKAYLIARLKKDLGYTDAQAAGTVGSLMQESGQTLDPTARNPTSGATGIAQWLGPRAKAFAEQFGHPLSQSTFGEQADFMLQELKTTEKRANERILMAKTPEQAAEIHAREYERPGAGEINVARRQANARALLASRGGRIPSADDMTIQELPNGAAASAPAVTASTVNRTSTTETNVNGPITVVTQATDANAIAAQMTSAIKRATTAGQANTGVSQ
jgi:hypothetical protein